MQLLLLRRLTGTIRLHDLESERIIALSPDELVMRTTGARETPKLGRVLLAAGHINQRQLDTALAIQRDDPRRLGEILVDQGILDAEAVIDGVMTKVVHELYDLFLWPGRYMGYLHKR